MDLARRDDELPVQCSHISIKNAHVAAVIGTDIERFLCGRGENLSCFFVPKANLSDKAALSAASMRERGERGVSQCQIGLLRFQYQILK